MKKTPVKKNAVVFKGSSTRAGDSHRTQGQRVGYIRVSSFDQNAQRQLEDVALDRIFTDKVSGKDMKRPQLEAMMQFVREGDTVVVHSLDRLARNLDDLRRIVTTLTGRGIRVEFVKESLIFNGDDSPMANLMLSVMGAFAEFERALIRERQREGIQLAREFGISRETLYQYLRTAEQTGQPVEHRSAVPAEA